jgi:hypothetical protein
MKCNWIFADKFIICKWKWNRRQNLVVKNDFILWLGSEKQWLSPEKNCLQSTDSGPNQERWKQNVRVYCSGPRLVARDDFSGLERVYKPSRPVKCKRSRTGNRRRWVVSSVIRPSSYAYPITEMDHVGGKKSSVPAGNRKIRSPSFAVHWKHSCSICGSSRVHISAGRLAILTAGIVP